MTHKGYILLDQCLEDNTEIILIVNFNNLKDVSFMSQMSSQETFD